MSQLLNIPIMIHGFWHAGNYDKNDFLGRLINSQWVKTFEKSTLSAPKSRPSKSKNIGKTLEGCSKSYFSHLRNDVEKMTLRPLISERFLAPTSAQDREKVV